LVHGWNYFLPVSGSDIHRPAADVLLPADSGIRLRRYHRPAPTGSVGNHARASSLGRACDGNFRLASHVSRVHDGIIQAASRVQLERWRHSSRPDTAPELHRIPVAVGSTRDVG